MNIIYCSYSLNVIQLWHEEYSYCSPISKFQYQFIKSDKKILSSKIHIFDEQDDTYVCPAQALPLHQELKIPEGVVFFPVSAGEKRDYIIEELKKSNTYCIRKGKKKGYVLCHINNSAGIACQRINLNQTTKKAIKQIRSFCRFKKFKAIIFDVYNASELKALQTIVHSFKNTEPFPFQAPPIIEIDEMSDLGLDYRGVQPRRLEKNNLNNPNECFASNRELSAAMQGDLKLQDKDSIYYFSNGNLVGVNDITLHSDMAGPKVVQGSGDIESFEVASCFSFEGLDCRGIRSIFTYKEDAEVIADYIFIENTNLFVLIFTASSPRRWMIHYN